MNHQSGRLVYHKKRIIFVNNIQWNILRLYLRFVASVGEGNCKYIQRLNLVVRLYNLSVGHHISGIYGKLNAIPGGALHMRTQILVCSHKRLTLIHHKPEMLKERAILFLYGIWVFGIWAFGVWVFGI